MKFKFIAAINYGLSQKTELVGLHFWNPELKIHSEIPELISEIKKQAKPEWMNEMNNQKNLIIE